MDNESFFNNVLKQFREAARSKREMGDAFERMIKRWLQIDPLYSGRFDSVWLWMEWPDRGSRPDTGIDLVAHEADGSGYCAIQCKFFDPGHTIQKSDIDSFFTVSGKKPFTRRMLISTTEHWGPNAEEALANQTIPVQRIGINALAESPVDWSRFNLKAPDKLTAIARKKLRPHQTAALKDVERGFATSDRGRLIMACGTGKTFTSLKIAEHLVSPGGRVLFLAPSIALVNQTLREWTAESSLPLHSLAVCSDEKVGQRRDDDVTIMAVHELAIPATTDEARLAKALKIDVGKRLTVVFSTYQSIEVVSKAQKNKGAPEFDLIICDEAHRTTGVTVADQDESAFVRVHKATFIKADKRLYMTATPRLYSDAAKKQAEQKDAVLCSMDDERWYGPEFHRLGFSRAVDEKLLSDYRVMVLAVNEEYVASTFQKQFTSRNSELNLEDGAKLVGCWNGLTKGTGRLLRRAVAFCGCINAPAQGSKRSMKTLPSKRFESEFPALVADLEKDDGRLTCDVRHVDGGMNAMIRAEKIDWLRADDAPPNECRILTNVRCLSEGVDVPGLDAVLFLNPRNSQVDVVQAVGRVMRRAKGKDYGYIILPVAVPAGVDPNTSLDNNERYRVVWQILQALRAHDDRFNATINKIDLNQSRPDNIQVIGVGFGGADDDGGGSAAGKKVEAALKQGVLAFPVEEWKNAIYAKIVDVCGEKAYWENWAKDVADIAGRHETRLKALLKEPTRQMTFNNFVAELRVTVNPSIGEDDAVEMLSQHLITRPVFDALFSDYEFARNNPVSRAMQGTLDVLAGDVLERETESLAPFYASVRRRVEGIDNDAARQKVTADLYGKFFSTAFPRMAERLGIVYTPVEVVDFILRSADSLLRREFGRGLTDKGVHVFDPFTGTGTFVARLLKSGLIRPEDMKRKFDGELHANDTVLLAYYIAAVNIELSYHGVAGGKYEPFDGIVLTDTFQQSEANAQHGGGLFPENNFRGRRQKNLPIEVIIANPPYSVGQNSENDANKNLKYPTLDGRITATYAANSKAKLKISLYDSYIRAIRWASDRIKDRGVIGFVTNGSFLDANAMDGLRKCLTEEFTSIYVFNLRGNARTSGEQRRKERGNVFGEGTRTPVAISLLVKNPATKERGRIFYHDIGDYLSREEKLRIVEERANVEGVQWSVIKPNAKNEWINQSNPEFDAFIPMGDKETKSGGGNIAIFELYSMGVKTNRDEWAYNFSRDALAFNMQSMINFYNNQVDMIKKGCKGTVTLDKVESMINNDPKKISWSGDLKMEAVKLRTFEYTDTAVTASAYRPFTKQWLYMNRRFNNSVYLQPKIFPLDSESPPLQRQCQTAGAPSKHGDFHHGSRSEERVLSPHGLGGARHSTPVQRTVFPTLRLRVRRGEMNLAICVTGIGAGVGFSALMVNVAPNLHCQDTGQSFPLYAYE